MINNLSNGLAMVTAKVVLSDLAWSSWWSSEAASAKPGGGGPLLGRIERLRVPPT
jgi:hypothetical protein